VSHIRVRAIGVSGKTIIFELSNYGNRSLFIPERFTGIEPGTTGAPTIFGLKAPMVPGALEA
jgi:hypothetical protein